jgi:uncharacterized protein YbjT (DUF2867 family)
VVRWPYGAAARSLIHEDDIAAVAVHALTGDGHAGRRYLLTGPEPVTRTVEEVTGVPARTFRQWVHDHVSDFRPTPQMPSPTRPARERTPRERR